MNKLLTSVLALGMFVCNTGAAFSVDFGSFAFVLA